MIKITIDDREVTATLRRLAAGGRDMSPVMRGIALELKAETDENFEAQGRPRWLGLAPSTQAGRRRRGTWPGMILSVSAGGLRSSITPSFGPDFAQVSTNKIYGAIHQFGGVTRAHVIRPRFKKALAFGDHPVKSVNHPGSRIPARPYFPVDAQGNLQPEAREMITGMIQGYLRSLVG